MTAETVSSIQLALIIAVIAGTITTELWDIFTNHSYKAWFQLCLAVFLTVNFKVGALAGLGMNASNLLDRILTGILSGGGLTVAQKLWGLVSAPLSKLMTAKPTDTTPTDKTSTDATTTPSDATAGGKS
jgi:4-amino-4-deoxy-L-arabinose transferase-like glycosyltransferase